MLIYNYLHHPTRIVHPFFVAPNCAEAEQLLRCYCDKHNISFYDFRLLSISKPVNNLNNQ